MMNEHAHKSAEIQELSPDAVIQIRDELAQSAALIERWLVVLENGSSDDALISPASFTDVLKQQTETVKRYSDSLPERRLTALLSEFLEARAVGLTFTLQALAELQLERSDPRWRSLLIGWARAGQLWAAACSSLADDVAKRWRGPRLRRAQADENNSTLINAIVWYRMDPRTGEPRSARTIASMLRRSPGFDNFTERRSDEALTRLIQRILRKSGTAHNGGA